MKISELVKARRTELGFSQAKLAEMVGVTSGMISHIENGERNISPRKAAAFEAALNIPKAQLLPEIFGEAA